MIDRQPTLIARCRGTADVIECVRFARDNDLLVCIKGRAQHRRTGRGRWALMLDMSLMRGVWVDRRQRCAHAQAGGLRGDVDRETEVRPHCA